MSPFCAAESHSMNTIWKKAAREGVSEGRLMKITVYRIDVGRPLAITFFSFSGDQSSAISPVFPPWDALVNIGNWLCLKMNVNSQT